jgi:hypothetical protein
VWTGGAIKDMSVRSCAKEIDHTSSAGIARLVKLKESRVIVIAVSFMMMKRSCD